MAYAPDDTPELVDLVGQDASPDSDQYDQSSPKRVKLEDRSGDTSEDNIIGKNENGTEAEEEEWKEEKERAGPSFKPQLEPQNPAAVLRNALQACITFVTAEMGNSIPTTEESKSSAEVALATFTDAAKHMETEFLRRELYWTTQRPDWALKEDMKMIQSEIQRKSMLLKKTRSVLEKWSNQESRLNPPTLPVPGAPLPLNTPSMFSQPGRFPDSKGFIKIGEPGTSVSFDGRSFGQTSQPQ